MDLNEYRFKKRKENKKAKKKNKNKREKQKQRRRTKNKKRKRIKRTKIKKRISERASRRILQIFLFPKSNSLKLKSIHRRRRRFASWNRGREW